MVRWIDVYDDSDADSDGNGNRANRTAKMMSFLRRWRFMYVNIDAVELI